MRIAVLGTSAVGCAIASKLVELGHEVTMGWLRLVGAVGGAEFNIAVVR